MKLVEAKSFIKYNYLCELTKLSKYEIVNSLRFGLTRNQQLLVMNWLENLSFKYYEKIKKYSYYNDFEEYFKNTKEYQLYIEIKNI